MDRTLIEDGVEDERRLAGLAVADDQLALAAADRDQSIDRLETGRHRLMHRLARDDPRRLDVDPPPLLRRDRSLAVDRIAERIDHPAEQLLADRHLDDGAGPLDRVALLDVGGGPKDHHTERRSLETER